MSAARDVQAQAIDWLIRFDDPDWSESDEAQLNEWLDASMAHKAAFWRAKQGWRAADRIASLGTTLQAEQSSVAILLNRAWKPAALAASLALALGLGSLLMRASEPVTLVAAQQFDTPVGGRREIGLPDGSLIELNTATVLKTSVTDTHREVWLNEGEAYFEVKHREAVPFIVHAGPKTVTVLGTRFVVRRQGNDVTVSVVEGRVRVEDVGANQDEHVAMMTVTAGDVVFAAGNSTLLVPNQQRRVERSLAWRDGLLRFDQTPLRDAVAEFNRYNKRQLVIEDAAVGDVRIGGTIQASNVQSFTRLLHDAYGLRIERTSQSVKISR